MLHRLLRGLYRRLNPSARNSLRSWLALEQRDHPPAPIQTFQHGTVVILAPHSDDEVIGCGGTSWLHAQSGTAVHVVYMTDGRWGDGSLYDSALSPAEQAQRQNELIRKRKDEASQAAAILGTRQLHFLDLPDGALRATPEWGQKLSTLLHTLQPDLIYTPFVFDLHEDHWQTNLLLAHAFKNASQPWCSKLLVRGYEVWTPLVPNCYADISAAMPHKRQALAQFHSQLKDQDYLRIVEGLNAYRSNGALGGRGFCEAFHELPLAGYLRLIEAAQLHTPMRVQR